jgi:hypothetical protein
MARSRASLSWKFVESLVAEDFDIDSCQSMQVDHAFTLPMALLWPDQDGLARTIPFSIDTMQAPLRRAGRHARRPPGAVRIHRRVRPAGPRRWTTQDADHESAWAAPRAAAQACRSKKGPRAG